MLGNIEMADIKLPQLPDRNPVKLSIAVMPDLHQALTDYAALYAQTYGREEPAVELIPAMRLAVGTNVDDVSELAKSA
jgi:hypothetical protein